MLSAGLSSAVSKMRSKESARLMADVHRNKGDIAANYMIAVLGSRYSRPMRHGSCRGFRQVTAGLGIFEENWRCNIKLLHDAYVVVPWPSAV